MDAQPPHHLTAGSALQAIYDSCEDMRARAITKHLRYKRNHRFRNASAYWEGIACAAASQRHVVGGYMRALGVFPLPDEVVNE